MPTSNRQGISTTLTDVTAWGVASRLLAGLLAIIWCASVFPAHTEVWPASSWEAVPPASVSMDPARTAAAVQYGRDRGGSGIITRWGRQVGSWGDQRAKYDLKSTTKSFGSIIAALAFKDKRITPESLVQPILPELGVPQSTAEKAAWLAGIRVKHLLTHTAGFGKVGGVTDLEFAPGTAWRYSDGGPNWLADLLTVLYQRDLKDILRERILAPMGITGDRLVCGITDTGPKRCAGSCGGNSARHLDRRRRDGAYRPDAFAQGPMGEHTDSGQGGCDAGYVASALAHRTAVCRCGPCDIPAPNEGYGFLFWTNTHGYYIGVPSTAYFAYGLHDSFILVIPSLGMVVARAGPEWTDDLSTFFGLVAGAVK